MKRTNFRAGKSNRDFESDEILEDRYANQYEAVSSWMSSLRNSEDTSNRGSFTPTTPWIPPSVPPEFPDETHPLFRTPPSDIIRSPRVPFGRPALGSQLDQALGQPSTSTPCPQDAFCLWESTSLPTWVTMASHGQSSKGPSKGSYRLNSGREELFQPEELHPYNDRPQSDAVQRPMTFVQNSLNLSQIDPEPTRDHGLYNEEQFVLGIARPLHKYRHGLGFRSEMSTRPEVQEDVHVAAPSHHSGDLVSSHHFHREKKKSPEQEVLMFTHENCGRSNNLSSASNLRNELLDLLENQAMHQQSKSLKQGFQGFSKGLEQPSKSNPISTFAQDHFPQITIHGQHEILNEVRQHNAKDEQKVVETAQLPDQFLHISPKSDVLIQRNTHRKSDGFNLKMATKSDGELVEHSHDQLHLQNTVSHKTPKSEIQITSSQQIKTSYSANDQNQWKTLQTESGATYADENCYPYDAFDLQKSSLINNRRERVAMVLSSTDNGSTPQTNPKTLDSQTKFSFCHQSVQTVPLSRCNCKINFGTISKQEKLCQCLPCRSLCDTYPHPHNVNQLLQQDVTCSKLSFNHHNQEFLSQAKDLENSRLHPCSNVRVQNPIPTAWSEHSLLTPKHLVDPHLLRPTEIPLGSEKVQESHDRAPKSKRKSSPLGYPGDKIHPSVSGDGEREQEKRLCTRKQLQGGPDPDILRSRILMASYNELQSAGSRPGRKRIRHNPFADVLTPFELKSLACNKGAELLTPKSVLEEGHIIRDPQSTVTRSSNRLTVLLQEENEEVRPNCRCHKNVIAIKPGEGLANHSRRKLWPSSTTGTVGSSDTYPGTQSLPQTETPSESHVSAVVHAPPAYVRADDRSSNLQVEESSECSIETQGPLSLASCNITTEEIHLNKHQSRGIFSQASIHGAGFKFDRCEPKAEVSRKTPPESFHGQQDRQLTVDSEKIISLLVARLLEIPFETKPIPNSNLPAPSPSACTFFSPRPLSVVNSEQESTKEIAQKEILKKYRDNDSEDSLMLGARATVTRTMPASITNAAALGGEENASQDFGYNQKNCSRSTSGKQNTLRRAFETTRLSQRIVDENDSGGGASRTIKGFSGNKASPNNDHGESALQERSKSSVDVQFRGTALCPTERSCTWKERIGREMTPIMEIASSPGHRGYLPSPSNLSMHMHTHEIMHKSDARTFFSNMIPKLESLDRPIKRSMPERIVVRRSKCSRLTTETDSSRRRQRCVDRLKASRITRRRRQKTPGVDSLTVPAEVSKSVKRCTLTVPKTKNERNIGASSGKSRTHKFQGADASSNAERPKVVSFFDYPQNSKPLTRKDQPPSARKPCLPEPAGSYLENFLLRPCVRDKQLHEDADWHLHREDSVIKSNTDQPSRSLTSRSRSSLRKSPDSSSEYSGAHGDAKFNRRRVQLHRSSSVSVVQQGTPKSASELSASAYHDMSLTTPPNYDFKMARKQSEYTRSRETSTCSKLDTSHGTFGAATISRPAADGEKSGINTFQKRKSKLRSLTRSTQIGEGEHKQNLTANEGCNTTHESFWSALHKQRLQKASSMEELEHNDNAMRLAREYQALTELMDVVFQFEENTTKSSALPQSNYRSTEANFAQIYSTVEECIRTTISGISGSRSESPNNFTKAKKISKRTPAGPLELGSKSGLQNGLSGSFSAKNIEQRSQPMVKRVRQSLRKQESETHAALVEETDVRFNRKSFHSMSTVVKIRSLTTKKTITSLKSKPKRSISKAKPIAMKELDSVVLPFDPRASSRYGCSFRKELDAKDGVRERRKPLLDQSLPRSFASITPIAPASRRKYNYNKPPWCKFYKIKSNQLDGHRGLILEGSARKEENAQNSTPHVNTVSPPLLGSQLVRTSQLNKTERPWNIITSSRQRRMRPDSVRPFSIPSRSRSSWFSTAKFPRPYVQSGSDPEIKAIEMLKAFWKRGLVKSEKDFDDITATQGMLAGEKNSLMLDPKEFESEKERNSKAVLKMIRVTSDAFNQAHHLHSVVVSSIRAVQWHGSRQENRSALNQDKMKHSNGAPTPISALQPSHLYSLTSCTIGTLKLFLTLRIPNLIHHIHTLMLFEIPEYSTGRRSGDSRISPVLGHDWTYYDDLWKVQLSPSMMTAAKAKPPLWGIFSEGVELTRILISRDHQTCPAFTDSSVFNNDNHNGNISSENFPSDLKFLSTGRQREFCDHEENLANSYPRPKFGTPFQDCLTSKSDFRAETTLLRRRYSWMCSISTVIEFSQGIPIMSGLPQGDYDLTKDQNGEPLHCEYSRLRACYSIRDVDACACAAAADVCPSLFLTPPGRQNSMTFEGCAALPVGSCTFQWLQPISRIKVFTSAWLGLNSRLEVAKGGGANFKAAKTGSVFRPLVLDSKDGYWTPHTQNKANTGSNIYGDRLVVNIQSQVAKGALFNQLPPTAAETSPDSELRVRPREIHRIADFMLSNKRKRRRMKARFW